MSCQSSTLQLSRGMVMVIETSRQSGNPLVVVVVVVVPVVVVLSVVVACAVSVVLASTQAQAACMREPAPNHHQTRSAKGHL